MVKASAKMGKARLDSVGSICHRPSQRQPESHHPLTTHCPVSRSSCNRSPSKTGKLLVVGGCFATQIDIAEIQSGKEKSYIQRIGARASSELSPPLVTSSEVGENECLNWQIHN